MAIDGESSYLFGMYDQGAESVMAEAGRTGWVVIEEVIGHDPGDTTGKDYQELAASGFGVIVVLENGRGTAGTLPVSDYYDNFATRCANFARESLGCHIWIIGNEPNSRAKRPGWGSPDEETITPPLYGRCYNKCRAAIRDQSGHHDDMVLVAAAAPYVNHTSYPGNKRGDWVRYVQDVLLLLGTTNYDGVTIHAHTHGIDAGQISHDQLMEPPFDDRYWDFKTYQDTMTVVPAKVPVFITQANPIPPFSDESSGQGWSDDEASNGWVQAAYQEINDWNQAHPERQIRSLVLYRWGAGSSEQPWWSIHNRPGVIEDFQLALQNDCQWTLPARPDYRAGFLDRKTPASYVAGDTMHVSIRLRNDGARTWRRDGSHPFRLGSHWYDSDGLEVLVPIGYRNSMPEDVPPGDEVTLTAKTMTPSTPGRYRLRWDMVHEGISWFSHHGDPGQTLFVEVKPAGMPRKPPIEDVVDELPHHPTKVYDTRPMDQIAAIIMHHSVVPPEVGAERIAQYHVEKRDWPGIGYHFFVCSDGHAQQTQYLETISYHAGEAGNRIGVGVCLSGDFTEEPPPDVQLSAAAQVVAWLLDTLELPLDAVHGHCDYKDTQCPGDTWKTIWRDLLLQEVQTILDQAQPGSPSAKFIDHYLLFWQTNSGWAREEWRGAESYISRFRPTLGFSIEDAMHAKHVTIVGGSMGVSAETEIRLRAAGCKVERIPGNTPDLIQAVMEELAVSGQRFLTLKA